MWRIPLWCAPTTSIGLGMQGLHAQCPIIHAHQGIYEFDRGISRGCGPCATRNALPALSTILCATVTVGGNLENFQGDDTLLVCRSGTSFAASAKTD
jgi:hypothetical protein